MRLKMNILRAECQDYDCKLDLDHNLTFKTSIFLFMPLSFILFIFDRCIMLCIHIYIYSQFGTFCEVNLFSPSGCRGDI